jgi:hypothetical protein
MKRMLLILMVLASVAMAGDAKMKALLTGTWIGSWHLGTGRTFTFQSDGKWLIDGEDPAKWDVKGGKLIVKWPDPESARPYTILFLSKHEFLARGDDHGQSYLFLTRQESE